MNFEDYFISQILTCITWLPRHMLLPSLLFHPQFLTWAQPERSEEMITIYQKAIDKHFTSQLRDIAQGHQPTGVETRLLMRTLKADVVQTAIIPSQKRIVQSTLSKSGLIFCKKSGRLLHSGGCNICRLTGLRIFLLIHSGACIFP